MNRIWEYVPHKDVERRSLEPLGAMKPHPASKLFEADGHSDAQAIVDHWHDYGSVPNTHVRKAVQLPHHGTAYVWVKV